MSSPGAFKQKLAAVARLWKKRAFDTALSEVEAALKVWPGHAHLHILWATLVQLQANPTHTLDEARQALQQVVALDHPRLPERSNLVTSSTTWTTTQRPHPGSMPKEWQRPDSY